MYTYGVGNDLWPSIIDLGLDFWPKKAISSNISTVLANNSKLGTCIPMEMKMFCTFTQIYKLCMYIQLQTQHLEYCPYCWRGFQLRNIGRPVWTLSIFFNKVTFSDLNFSSMVNGKICVLECRFHKSESAYMF